MNMIFSRLMGAIAGVAFCIASLKLAEWARLTAAFPVFAGEGDFAVRGQLFVFGLIPAFLLLGGWIGGAFQSNRRVGLAMLAGAIAGTATHLALWYALIPTLHTLQTSDAANRAVMICDFTWVLFIALAAFFARRLIGGSSRPHFKQA